jgi:hypothetical protein
MANVVACVYWLGRALILDQLLRIVLEQCLPAVVQCVVGRGAEGVVLCQGSAAGGYSLIGTEVDFGRPSTGR